jgi:prolyl-tRNA synthetase
MPRTQFLADVVSILDDVQHAIHERARAFRDASMQRIDSKDDFYDWFKGDEAPGFALAHWSGDPAIEEQVQNDLKVTLRCIPLDDEEGAGTCPFTGKPSPQRVVWAKAY